MCVGLRGGEGGGGGCGTRSVRVLRVHCVEIAFACELEVGKGRG